MSGHKCIDYYYDVSGITNSSVSLACEQAHLFGASCEYLGGGVAICEPAEEASRDLRAGEAGEENGAEDTRTKPQTSEPDLRLLLVK